MPDKSDLPRTLIQIHYHARPCGVMRVMRHYAGAFKNISGTSGSVNLLICDSRPPEKYPEFPDGSVRELPLAGYKTFRSKKEFLADRLVIVKSIASLFLSDDIPAPVAVVAHNLTLCKNAALVSAFAELARTFAFQRADFRFYSVAHDFAEEGRVPPLREIEKISRWGVDLHRDISADGAPVGFIAVNGRAHGALRKAGVAVSLLQNPVNVDSAARISKPDARKKIRHLLVEHCREKKIPFDARRPVFACPARTISRKNPLEAVLIACILYEGCLLLGGAGSTAADKKRHQEIKNFVKKLGLPVITDIQSIVAGRENYGNVLPENPMPVILAGSDAVVSTSVTEGFGYLLLEPWLYGTPVFGRLPAGCRPVTPLAESLLYRALPVDAGNAGRADFAQLPFAAQQAVIKRFVSGPAYRDTWKRGPGKRVRLLSVLEKTTPAMARQTRTVIARKFSLKKFRRDFEKCFGCPPKTVKRPVDWNLVAKEYGTTRVFRFS